MSDARIPMPPEAQELGLDPIAWRVLVEAIFPSARTADSVILAVRYCRVRGWDVFRRPVHIVPVWDRASGREVETVWPGIHSLISEAHRTGAFVGADPAMHGPTIEIAAGSARLTVPEWTRVTVRRRVQDTVASFTGEVWWREIYGRRRDGTPTEIWSTRPYSQAAKCALAAALRLGFPEAADYSAEEMAGQVVDMDTLQSARSAVSALSAPAAAADMTPALPPKSAAAAVPADVEARRAALRAAAASVTAAKSRRPQIELITADGESIMLDSASTWLRRFGEELDTIVDPDRARQVARANEQTLRRLADRWPDAAAPLLRRVELIERVASAAGETDADGSAVESD